MPAEREFQDCLRLEIYVNDSGFAFSFLISGSLAIRLQTNGFFAKDFSG
jgi:hypothetical protein